MVGHTFQHSGLAGAADAFAAAVVHIDTGVQQRVQQGLVGRDLDEAAAALELHRVVAARIGRCLDFHGREALDMGVGMAELGAELLEGIEHGRRAAGIVVQARIGCALRQQCPQVGRAARLCIEVQMQRHAQGLQLGQKGRALALARKVQHLERMPQGLEAACHAQHGRDAYAAGHQHRMRRRLVKREVVARLGDGDGHAHAQRLVHAARATAAGAVAQHADHVAVALAAVVGQGIAAHQPVGQVQIDVRAGRESRKLAAIDRAQLHADGVLGLEAQRVHKGLQAVAHDAMPSSICSWAWRRR
ncbi:hypothetical protein SDC9_135372 [bioreactor metagenome]|uniref:Uncharacterized protein n=1 Tax=bioreactor metagenome TaxID=1076179 RepID=A0A645DFL0_9ZZZZ